MKKSDWSTLDVINRGFVQSASKFLFERASPYRQFLLALSQMDLNLLCQGLSFVVEMMVRQQFIYKNVIFVLGERWWGWEVGVGYHFLCPLYQKELLKECFRQILMPPYSGPTGTDFSELGQSRAKRSDPCVREPVAGGDEAAH